MEVLKSASGNQQDRLENSIVKPMPPSPKEIVTTAAAPVRYSDSRFGFAAPMGSSQFKIGLPVGFANLPQ